MRMAWLILAHDEPEQLDRLLARLVPEGSPDVAIVHADARSALWPKLLARWPEDTARVRLIRDPVAVRWGHWSQVAAIGRLIDAALPLGCDYAHLLSGVDWPVVGHGQLAAQLAADPRRPCHIEAEPGVQDNRMQTWRLDARWLRLDPVRDRIGYSICWELRRIARWLDGARAALGWKRAQPFGQWRKGWTWWSLPGDVLPAVAADLSALLASGRLRGTVCADEHVIPTIVAARFADRLAGYRRFVRFPEGQSSPRLLTAEDLPAIRASDAWFMRKVSAEQDDFFLRLPEAPAIHGAVRSNAI